MFRSMPKRSVIDWLTSFLGPPPPPPRHHFARYRGSISRTVAPVWLVSTSGRPPAVTEDDGEGVDREFPAN
jgi:hypothetical protein